MGLRTKHQAGRGGVLQRLTNGGPGALNRMWRRIMRATGIALTIAFVLAIWTLVVNVLGGTDPFEAHGTTSHTVIWLYVGAAVLVGILVGVLQPLGRRPSGAALIGFLVALPSFGMMWILRGERAWSYLDTITMLIWATVLGAPLGVIYRALFRSRDG